MTKLKDYVLVLWGHNFEETTAVTFIAQLRAAGLLVKVVGLTPGQIGGMHGLALVPDLTLGKALALARQVSCIIIPAVSADLSSLRNDPRLGELYQQAYLNGARFVVGSLICPDLTAPESLPAPAANIIPYPAEQELTLFINELIGLLRGREQVLMDG